ncbi:MAG: RHS repeat-associated core domain-containing protein [Sulfuricaulis sp.]
MSSLGGERSIRILPGQYFDQETGLYYNGARYYDPRIGRYISSDPMGVAEHVALWQATLGTPNQQPLELNSYSYVGGNPLRWIDPRGLASSGTPPFRGPPNTWWDGPIQQRLYGPDGYPEVDIDWHTDHGAGSPHAHNWDRPPGGGAPSSGNRGR